MKGVKVPEYGGQTYDERTRGLGGLQTSCGEENLLPVKTVIEMLAGVAEALDFAHGSEIVHRDIKPANLMRVGPQAVKIMDFGLAKNPATQLTSDGTLLGTPSYMSPEQIRGGAVDGRSVPSHRTSCRRRLRWCFNGIRASSALSRS